VEVLGIVPKARASEWLARWEEENEESGTL